MLNFAYIPDDVRDDDFQKLKSSIDVVNEINVQ